MPDKLNLLNTAIPLQKRYDDFIIWLSKKNHAVIEFMAQELEISVSEVDVFNELDSLDEDEFEIIDSIGFDVGLLFIIVRSPKEVRKIMYDRSKEILNSEQPLTKLKSIVDEHSDYTSIEELAKKVTGNCWKSIASYLRQRDIASGTINKKIRQMFMQVGNQITAGNAISEGQLSWIIRAIEHDKANSLGVFTNDTIKTEFQEDYLIFTQIHQHINKYGTN